MMPLPMVAWVGMHRRDLQDDARGRQQSGGPLIDRLLVEIAAPMAAKLNHAAPVAGLGQAHPQADPFGRHLDDPAAGAAYSDRGLDRIVHDCILPRAEPESTTAPRTSGVLQVNTRA